MASCPDPATVDRYARGQLTPDAADEVRAHVSGCSACGRAISELAHTVDAPHADTTEPPPAPAEELSPGTRVGRYTIERRLGGGAMGIVFAAHDPDLDRTIAIKIMRSSAGGTGDSTRRRTQREARAIARLSDPHVVAVYDVGMLGDELFLAMELVDGGTLREVIERTRPGWGDVLGFYLQAGRGLAAAHRAGILHRDFKPDNVLFGRDGRVRVGDFGLARDATDAPASETGAAPRSLTVTATQAGTIVGTPAYMAPEQMRAEKTDARADVFAFCASLYEGLYGERPFEGGDFAALLRSVEDGTTRPAPAGTAVPAEVRACVLRGLAARADDRWPSMASLLAALEATSSPAASPRDTGRTRWIAGACAGALGLSVAVALGRGPAARTAPPSPPPQASSSPAAGPPPFSPVDVRRLTFGYGCSEYPSFTPDGRAVVYSATAGKDEQIFELDDGATAPRPLTSGPGWHYAAEVSPDGRRVAFLFGHGETSGAMVMPRDGTGKPVRVGEAGARPTWALDGSCVWVGRGPASCVDPDTGSILRAIAPPPGVAVLRARELGPGTLVAQFIETESRLARGLAVYEPGSPEPRWLSHERFEDVLLPTPDGQSVIVAQVLNDVTVELWRVPLDGSPHEPLRRPDLQPTKGLVYSAASDRIVWSVCGFEPQLAVLRSPTRGALRADPLFAQSDWRDDQPAWVPGTSLLAVMSGRSSDNGLWLVDRDGVAPAREVALGGVRATSPAASPSGDRLVFASPDGGIFVVPATGAAPPRRVTSGSGDASPTFDSLGQSIYFDRPEGTSRRVYVVPVEGGEEKPALPPGTSAPSASSGAPQVAYIQEIDGRDGARPMLFDPRTGRSRPLAPALGWGEYGEVRLSPTGQRAAVRVGQDGLVEVDVASGAVLARFDGGADVVSGLTYVDSSIVASLSRWRGGLWTARAPFGTGAEAGKAAPQP